MFAQVDAASSGGGLGIGLALVERLVALHGGTVRARSDGPGTGSEFVVRLPLGCRGRPAREPEAAERQDRWQAACRVLVVDDNEDAAVMLGMVLERLGHEVRTAFDGAAALEVGADFGPDVVLMDLAMPRLSGFETARRLRGERWGERVFLVALSGWGQERDSERTLAAGFDHHLVKPVEPAVLAELLARRRPEDRGGRS